MGQPEARCGEVVEASTTSFRAQCYELYQAPPLGALVRVGKPALFGVVSNIATEGLDPGRRTVARGREAETEEEVYREHPQLTRLLATYLEAVLVGHEEEQGIRHYLPPVPPRVHAFVFRCTLEEVRRFTASLDFIQPLLSANIPTVDEVMAAFLRQASLCQENPQAFLVQAGRALAAELGGELSRLNAILRRLSL